MPPRANAGRGNRLVEHQNGKGDKDRSPGYRQHYDEVNWSTQGDDGFVRVNPHRIRKTYGMRRDIYPTIAGGSFDKVAPAGMIGIVGVDGPSTVIDSSAEI